MNRLFSTSFVGIGMLLYGVAAQAQYYPGQRYPGRDDGYGNGGYRGGDRSYALFDRVRVDLDRAAANSYMSGGDRRRVQKARHDLADFQNRWSRGRFDRHELDEAIGRVQSVVNSSRLSYRDRAALQDDLSRMREFRAYQAQGGDRYGDGYRR